MILLRKRKGQRMRMEGRSKEGRKEEDVERVREKKRVAPVC